MTPEEKDMLRKSFELSQENNKILRSMQSKARWEAFFKIIYWCVIIALAFSAYFFVKPYYDALLNVYKNISSDISSIKGATNNIPDSFLNLFKK